MSSDPLVSIVVPVYNVERYLRECIDSILGQTYSHIEVIIVNDGSTDGSPALCDQYKQSDSRVTVIHKENGGLSSARNAGLGVMSGEYITFVDSDDWVDLHYIEHHVRCAVQGDDTITWARYRIVSEDSSILSSDSDDGDIPHIFSQKEALRELSVVQYRNTLLPTTWGKLFRTRAFQNIRFPDGRIREDEFVAHRWIASALSLVRVNNAVYYYRQRQNSLMSSNLLHTKRCLDVLDAIADRVDFYQMSGLDEHVEEAAMCGLRHAFIYLVDAATWSDKLLPKDRSLMIQYVTTRAKHFSRLVRSEVKLEKEQGRAFRTFVRYPTVYAAWTWWRRTGKLFEQYQVRKS